jgi:uncharacterized ferritin-like protein (DUF455 family)
MSDGTSACGFSIKKTAEHLRNYTCLERRSIRLLAGWFLREPAYETKYRLAYALYDASEHVTLLRVRLNEMRAGNPDANVRPELRECVDACLHAPDAVNFLRGYFGVLLEAKLAALEADMSQLDPAGNANELRLFRSIKNGLHEQRNWYRTLSIGESKWSQSLRQRLDDIGGIHGEETKASSMSQLDELSPFQRPQTIEFDERIAIGELVRYEERQCLSSHEATVEQFKVFFNEFYAAALLASILYDTADNDYPWEFFADFSRHFWDEARHSEFGAVRLRELGVKPDRVNPVLFEQSQDLPVLHRIAYLTRGLEAYFMPRKPKRFKEYEQNGDLRSQLFADQDWSDEINHVRYGSRWTEYLLQDDFRDIDDVIEEVKQHLGRKRGEPVLDISAPF